MNRDYVIPYPSPRPLRWFACALLASSVAIFAQTEPPASSSASTSPSASQPVPTTTTTTAPATTPTPTEEQAILLSPFEVDASMDKGYRATSTLAGSRINTDLSDLAAPIQVATKELLNDINATSINDVLAYTANTEGSRTFTQSTVTLGQPNDDRAQNPNGVTRIRGLSAPDIDRDYFYTLASLYVSFDSYNIDEVTINMGPNSVLSGLGSPAGIVNYSPQTAHLSKDSTELLYRFGSWGDQRSVLNTNIVALQDVLAFRVAGEWSNVGFKQQPAYDHDKRGYVAVTYKPISKTTVHASYEIVTKDTHEPNSITPVDQITPWLEAGKPIYNSTNPSSATISATNIGLYEGAGDFSAIHNANGTISAAYNLATQYAYGQNANTGVFVPLGFSSDKYANFQDMNFSPSLGHYRLDSFNFSVDQNILPGLNANVGGVYEHFQDHYTNLGRFDSMAVDINEYLPNGVLNPNVGQTYMQYEGIDNLQGVDDTNHVVRGTLTYDLDLNKFNEWLGRYRFTGFGEDRRTSDHYVDYQLSRADLTYAAGKGSYPEVGNVYYLDGTAANGYKAQTVPGGVSPLYQVPAIDIVNGQPVNDTLSETWILNQTNSQVTKLESVAASFQAWLFGNRVLPMIGIRRDKQDEAYATSNQSNVDPESGLIGPLPPAGPHTLFSATTKTYGVVIKPLPVDWISFHYNHATNFDPNAVGKVDLLNSPQAAPQGISKDYGFSLDLFQHKLNVMVNWFNLSAAHQDATSVTSPLSMWILPWMEQTVMPELAAKAGVTYQPLMSSALAVGDAQIGGYTMDQVTKGVEIEATYNITSNWRMMFNVSSQQAVLNNIAPNLTSFIQNRLAYWQGTPAIWTGVKTSNNPWGYVGTGQQWWNQFGLPAYVYYTSQNGKPDQQLAKYHGSLASTYTFNTGPVKGLFVGTGWIYTDKAVIGDPAIYGLVNGAETVTGLDLAHPYTRPAYVSIDAWIGYTVPKLFKRYQVTFQLNGQDLQESGSFEPILANSDGTHAAFAIRQPRRFYFTTKVDF